MLRWTLPYLAVLYLGTTAASAQTVCSATTTAEPRVGSWCNQVWVNFFWEVYSFDKGDWDDGFGFFDACNLSLPLARTFNAIYVLNYADGPSSKSTSDFSGSILHWGGNYTMREIDELDGRCGGSDAPRARTTWGLVIDNKTVLFRQFFYNENVVERAGTLLHEARHADWCGHNGNDGSNACPSGSDSCDESFTDGCSGFGSPSGRGATGFQALWLWWFTVDADSITGGNVRKAFARDEANRIFDTMFDIDPCINITSSGAVIDTCPNQQIPPNLRRLERTVDDCSGSLQVGEHTPRIVIDKGESVSFPVSDPEIIWYCVVDGDPHRERTACDDNTTWVRITRGATGNGFVTECFGP